MALTGDTFQSSERTKALGLLEAANGLGKVQSPILGSLIALLSWYAPFFAYGLLAFPIAIGVWLLVPEKKQNLSKDSLAQYWCKVKEVFREQATHLIACYLVGMVALFLLFGVLSYVSDVLESTYHLFGLVKGFVLAVPVFSMALTSYLSGLYLAQKRSLWKPIIVGAMFAVAACLALQPFFTKLVPYDRTVLLGYWNRHRPSSINSLITGATSAGPPGIITCLYGTVRFFGVAIGPPTFGLALELGKWFLFLSSAALAVITALVALFAITPPPAGAYTASRTNFLGRNPMATAVSRGAWHSVVELPETRRLISPHQRDHDGDRQGTGA